MVFFGLTDCIVDPDHLSPAVGPDRSTKSSGWPKRTGRFLGRLSKSFDCQSARVSDPPGGGVESG